LSTRQEADRREEAAVLSTLQIVVIVVVTAVGATVQGSIGVGLALIAGPALVAVDGGFAPGPLLLAGQMIGMRHVLAEWRCADRAAFKHCLWGLPTGLAGGLLLLVAVSDRTMAIIVGAITALAAAALLAGASVARNRRVEMAGGAACTFASVTAGLPGPPLVITFSDMAPPTMRSTSSMFVTAVSATGFIGLVATGNFGNRELQLLGWLVPGVAAGMVAARWVRPLLDRHWFRPTILTVALLGGLALVARQF
jgi:uncharacterized membrane protein YfcA